MANNKRWQANLYTLSLRHITYKMINTVSFFNEVFVNVSDGDFVNDLLNLYTIWLSVAVGNT